MTAFDAMLETLFANPDLGMDAVHWPQGAAPGATVRLLLATDRPDIPAGLGRVVVERTIGQVRQSELPAVGPGDYLVAGGITYRIGAPPERDSSGVWRLALHRGAAL